MASIAIILVGPTLAGCAGEAADSTAESGTEAPQRLVTAEFTVEGMTCGGCALATEMAVGELEGVESVDAEYLGESKGGRCTVEYDPTAVNTDRIAAAIREAGFAPTLDSGPSGT